MNKLLYCVVAFLLLSNTSWAGEPTKLVPLRFLLGEWQSVGNRRPEEGTGSTKFVRGLQDRVIFRNNYAEYPGNMSQSTYRHDDLMIIYVEADSLVKADYFDSEGHVIRYVVNTSADGEVIFLSEFYPTTSRFRLAYKLTPDRILHGKFDVAPPGKPEEFSPYLDWTSRKIILNDRNAR